ncbi:hypothetical protein [Methanoregula sp. UBA64]|jgi:uncharacterized membrane protein (DUF4010 family)|uniref:hypothetical protein n=1 Tax=Methanoregula sp. UBA64 TaxID=1915554 RepID=UPI0025E0C7C3|nr:hypothetical protein [Methanoregula sp. UBA64]
MERKIGLLVLLVMGIIVSVIGFALAQFLPTLIIIVLIVAVFLYLDYQESHKEGQKDLKKKAAAAVFVIVTAYCMITGLWIFWAGITAILYVETLADSIMERCDARHRVDPGTGTMQTPSTGNTLEPIRQSLFLLEQRVNVLEKEKGK